ncbi:hypothetical protein AAP_02138 [Ascosphaera apis ARSEF 7405]|uniref:Uncharacterized protein n=1 Tax=Ascosphaera apis ARSEF 7405 TaxID=392613 RepID=A0A168AKP1_9EURO|nr:hypothetical protein AAP_02138 [Ascosphaera apis ARSEF 7405]
MDNNEAGRDTEVKSSKRPQSIMALSLAAQIDSAFSLDGTSDIDNLAKSVTFKKQTVDQQAQELHNLEARLRETEERLRQQQQQLPQLQGQSSGSSQQGSPYAKYSSNSASASQTSFHHANSYPRSPVQVPPSSSRPSSRTPSMQQMNQAYQYGAAGSAQRYPTGYGQQQAYPYRAASGR